MNKRLPFFLSLLGVVLFAVSLAYWIMTTLPRVTCPSPPSATWSPFLTLRMVVDLAGCIATGYSFAGEFAY